jgi:hypothetical protein
MAPQVGGIDGRGDDVKGARWDVLIAAGTPVGLERLVRLDEANLDLGSVGVQLVGAVVWHADHPKIAQRTSASSTSNAPATIA